MVPFNSRNDDCNPPAWYVGLDMQMYWSIPILAYLYARKRKIGVAALGGFMFIMYIVNFSICYHYKLNFFSRTYEQVIAFEKYYYMRPWMRTAPVNMGIWCAFFYYAYKYETYEESHLHKIMHKIKNTWWIRAIMYFVGVCLFTMMVFYKYPAVKHPERWDGRFRASWIITIQDLLLCLGLSLIVLPLLVAERNVVVEFLSWRFFGVLAKLCFGVYILHYLVIRYRAFNAVGSFWEGTNIRINIFFGDTVICFLLSILLNLTVELPFANLAQEFIFKKKSGKKVTKDKSVKAIQK